MADEIHVFSSADTNAPVLTGETGKLVDLLTACLVNGYATVSVSSITRSGTTATCTTGSAHGLVTGKMATIAGATETDYNGRFIVTVTSTTVFEYTVANSPTTPATGTITARRASAGWDLQYSGTNKAVYRSPNNAGARHSFRFQDDGSSSGGAKEAFMRGYVSMSDVDTGSEPFPTVAQQATGLYVAKSITANTTARSWALYADDKTAYLIIANGTNTLVFGFGHFNSWVAGDAYNSFISGSVYANTVSTASVASGVANGTGLQASSIQDAGTIWIPRAINQSGASVRGFTFGTGNTASGGASAHGYGPSTGGSFSVSGPSANADGGLYVMPVIVMQFVSSNAHIMRGQLPGLYAPLHTYGSVSDGSTSTGVAGLTGRSLYHQGHTGVSTNGSSVTGQICFDLTGPW